MHVMTGGHAAHGSGFANSTVSSHPSTGTVSTGAAAAVGHSHQHTEPLAGHAEKPSAAAGSCGGSCHSMVTSAASCTPSAKTGTLTVFPPPAGGVIVHPDPHWSGHPARIYPYRPPGPTPCELSISRT